MGGSGTGTRADITELVSWALTSLDSVKDFLGITGTASDDLLTKLINSASAFMEQYTSRKLKARNYDYSVVTDMEDTWRDGDGTKKIFLRQWPLNSVTSPILVSGESITVAPSTDYYGSTGFISYNLRGELFYNNGFDVGKQNVRVSYNAGYVTTSPGYLELEMACQEFVALVHGQKDKLAFKSEKIGNYSYSIRDLKELEGRGITTPTAILEKYRRKLHG